MAGRALGCALAAVLLLAVTVAAAPTTASGATLTLTAVADSYVRSDQSSTNFGTATQLASNGSTTTTKISYIRFDVTGLSGPPASATLSYYSQSTGTTKTAVRLVTGAWDEYTVTYANRPSYGAIISTTGALTAGTWASADVSSVVTGNGSYSFALTTTATASRYADSREAANPPQLILTQNDVSPTPSATSASPTPSVSTTPTGTASTSTPPSTSTSPAVDPVIAVAGDIACDPDDLNFYGGAGTTGHCHMKTTANLIQHMKPTAVLALGDEQYNSGSSGDFLASYDKSWGLVKGLTRPAVGNHEYGTSGAGGYFGYFKTAATGGTSCLSKCPGYYSFDVGSWHLVAINTECSRLDGAAGCAVGSPQELWLKDDLSKHRNQCTLVFGHRPRWSSNSFASADIAPLINDMAAARVDVYLAGHSHSYERFAPMTGSGAASATGITEIVVGTGGSFFTGFGTTVANSEVHKSKIFGVLKMTLHAGSYSWSFSADSSTPFSDSGSRNCY